MGWQWPDFMLGCVSWFDVDSDRKMVMGREICLEQGILSLVELEALFRCHFIRHLSNLSLDIKG